MPGKIKPLKDRIKIGREMLKLREQGTEDMQLAVQFRCSSVTVRNYLRMVERCITEEQILNWLGSDNTLNSAVQVISEVINEGYEAEELKNDILQG